MLANRDVRVAAQRALFHVHVRNADLLERRAEQLQELLGLRRRPQVRLGHDLDKRRPSTVEVDDRLSRAVDAARLPHVDQLGRVLLQVYAVDANGGPPGTVSCPLTASGKSYWLIW